MPTQKFGVNQLREMFLSFFETKEHLRLPSFSLIPQNDASLLLINSGMAPMKKWFLGQEEPPRHRVTTCQKCIRTPDIERVGITARHGTYFEMLGNFSFQDYFKREATAWAWEFLTKVLEIPAELLYISVYEEDDEAWDIWVNEVGIDPSHMVRFGKEDNFWEHGSGPCGPCSEIYFDRGPECGCGRPECKVGCDCDRYMEIWNLVFSQFDSDGNGHYTRMPKPNIDTGMGLERLACVMQNVGNLFEVDTVQNIMKHICRIAGVEYKKDEKTDISLRVITDHIRSTTFMIGDGILPSNEGRGYVLRRLLRRAARHGRLLGIQGAFLYEVARTVINENECAYPELRENEDYIVKVIKAEEERFQKTIDQGMEQLQEMIASFGGKGGQLSGEDAFRLYDTFGFPIDLTREILSEQNITIDEEEFTRLMNEQRVRAREARKDVSGWSTDSIDLTALAPTEFTGYQTLEQEASVLAIVRDGSFADSVEEGQQATIILNKTSFYGESGGQVGDTGVIVSGENVFAVQDTKKDHEGHFMHIGVVQKGSFNSGDAVTARVDELRRRRIMSNHSVCHLLQLALREVLGTHVHQAGSYYDEHRCRFDFSHFSAMTKEEIQQVQDKVNRMILEGHPVQIEELPIAEAKNKGAMALFGEKYGDIVRVCTMGDSVEFCGGTHVANTAQIGVVKIISESSVAAGVRRIEAATGMGVLELLDNAEGVINAVASEFKAAGQAEVVAKAQAVAKELKAQSREIESLQAQIANSKTKELFERAVSVKGLRYIHAVLKDTAADSLRTLGDQVKADAPDVVAVFAASNEGKSSVLAVCGADAVKAGAHAGKLIKEITAQLGGKGGGRPDSAMGGVADLSKAEEVLSGVPALLEGMVK